MCSSPNIMLVIQKKKTHGMAGPIQKLGRTKYSSTSDLHNLTDYPFIYFGAK